MKNLRMSLLKWSVPIQKWMQKIHPPEPNCTFMQAIEAVAEMQIGDILISKNHFRLTNLFIPGDWSHAAIYNGHHVVEAVGGGVQEVHPVEWMLKCNDFAILRPNSELNAEAKSVMYLWLRSKIGKPYDYMFHYSNSTEAFYCSEFAHLAWVNVEHINPWSADFSFRKTFGEMTIVADDFYNAVKKGKLTLIHEHYQKGKK